MGRPNLRLRAEIRKLFSNGEIHRGRWMHVRLGNSHLSLTLISVRKRYGGAVSRNRARRRLRVLCREFGPHGHPGKLLMVSLSDNARHTGYQALRTDLLSAFQTLGLTEP